MKLLRMATLTRWLGLAATLVCTLPAHAALNVLTCEPEWAALVATLGKDRVQVSSATTAAQDPHHIEARPSLLAKARKANLMVCTGAELETGWLPLLQRDAGNPAIQNPQTGYLDASRYVRLIEKPATVDRSAGDIHAAGNPHIHLNPHNLLPVADAISARLTQLDPAGATAYATQLQQFKTQWNTAMQRWEKQGASLKGVPVVVQHRNFSYLVQWLGLTVVAELEPKPGIEPSAAYLAQLSARLRRQPPRMILRAHYESGRGSDWLADRNGLKAVVLPYTVGGSAKANDLIGLFDDTLNQLTAAAKTAP